MHKTMDNARESLCGGTGLFEGQCQTQVSASTSHRAKLNTLVSGAIVLVSLVCNIGAKSEGGFTFWHRNLLLQKLFPSQIVTFLVWSN